VQRPTTNALQQWFGKMHSPQLWAVLQYRPTAGLCHGSYTYEDLLFIQVCSDPPPNNCNTGFGKSHSPLLSAALQNTLAAGLCHCNYICEDLLFIQVCSDPPSMQCNTGFGKTRSHSCGLLFNIGQQQACVTAITRMKI